MRPIFSWAGIVLSAAGPIAAAFLDTPEVEDILGIQISSPWLVLFFVALFILVVLWRVVALEQELDKFRRDYPSLTVGLPPDESVDPISSKSFEISIENEPEHAEAKAARIYLQKVDPPQARANAPSRLAEPDRDISPHTTVRCRVLSIQSGTTGGKPRAEATCFLDAGGLGLDLIDGSEEYTLQYRVVATNLRTGVDFQCHMRRRVEDHEYRWDFRWRSL